MAYDSYDACLEGLEGAYNPTATDFTLHQNADYERHFKNDPEWSPEKREKVKRYRYVVCLLGLSCMALGLMSRIMLNVAIVEMVDDSPTVERATEPPSSVNTMDSVSDMTTQNSNLGESSTISYVTETLRAYDEANLNDDDDGKPARFNWSVKEQNLLLASFYFGYAPAIMLGGGLVGRYGSKYPILIAALGTAFFNLITPTIAQISLPLLICSRIVLGLIQGALMPAMYDLFNKWLTPTEISIFAPMIKVFMALGCLFGNMVPGIAVALGFNWPFMFYSGSILSFVWSLFWIPLASSSPQDNRFVESNELKRIMRKKKVSVATIQENGKAKESGDSEKKVKKDPTPWLQIATNPSVLALTLVKFTYNVGLDVICLELAVYLKNIHQAPTETISAIASAGSFLQVIFVTPIGYVARMLVDRRTFGLSKTKWRKIFQGGSNFAMGLAMFGMSRAGDNLTLVTWLVVAIFFFWMLGAGGESMVPYDLSHKYPAAIVGMAHSISLSSSFIVPSLCGMILGDTNTDPSRWNLIFLLGSIGLSFGGLVFVLVLKAKPFLPNERDKPAATKEEDDKKKKAADVEAANGTKGQNGSL